MRSKDIGSIRVNCVIVEDEPLASEILEQFVDECKELSLLRSFSTAIEVREFLKEQKVDLLFLDINLPDLSGIDFIRSLANPPLVIFTTAYSQYAVEGFNVDAIDYLLKPISFERFRKAVDKVLQKLSVQRQAPSVLKPFIMLKCDKKYYKVDVESVLYLEAVGDYVKVCTEREKLVVHDTIRSLHEELGTEQFVRVHKSYVVALNKIHYLEGNMLRVGDRMLTVSLSFKDELLRRLRSEE